MTSSQSEQGSRNVFSRLQAVRDWLAHLIADVDTGLVKRIAVLTGLAQLVLLGLTLLYGVMLQADGSYFAYGIATGQPGPLWWDHILSRVSVYALVILPTQFVTDLVGLEGMALAAVYGLFFYGLQLVLYIIALALVWRRHPRLIIFPVAQYALATTMGYGFPSEILIAAGFLWISMFLVIRGRTFSLPFALSFIALVFSHELGLPAALVVAVYAFRQMSRAGAPVWRRGVLVAGVAACLVLFVLARLSGGGATSNMIYVFDPRRLLNHPVAWLIAGAVLIVLGVRALQPRLRMPSWLGWSLGLLLVAVPISLYLSPLAVNFEIGRYGSARTLIGGMMFVLALLAAAEVKADPAIAAARPARFSHTVPIIIIASLALSFGANLAFIHDYDRALGAIEKLAGSGPPGEVRVLSYADAMAELPEEEAAAIERMGYPWTLPFRSVMVADGYSPARILDSGSGATPHCDKIGLAETGEGDVPAPVDRLIGRLSCQTGS